MSMKTILVPVAGGDAAVLETARTVAQATAAHVRFLHVSHEAGEAALHMPHISYAIGASIGKSLQRLDEMEAQRATMAAQNVSAFCTRWSIATAEAPGNTQAATAQWLIENGNAVQRLLFHARHSDLIIMGRPTQSDGLPEDRLETMLLQSGRPLLVVPSNRPLRSLSIVLVCWKETAEAVRAVSAALPLLMAGGMVKVVSVAENNPQVEEGLRELVAYLAWYGLAAESEVVAGRNQPTQDVLLSAARNLRADLMIMGGYGHAHAREVLFGGCTQEMLESAELPVLLMH